MNINMNINMKKNIIINSNINAEFGPICTTNIEIQIDRTSGEKI